MTRGQTLAEARRRWHGNRAHFFEVVEYERRGKPWFAVGYSRVGFASPTPKFKAMGRGASWEAAFLDADKRGGK